MTAEHGRWQLICEPRFERELQALEPNAPRADVFVEYAVQMLSRNPHMGTQIEPDSPVWFLPMRQSATETPVVLYYCFDDARVWFMSIQTTGYDE